MRFIRTSSICLLVACLVVGPLLMGSYYGSWRWPLIWIASLAGLMLTLMPLEKKVGKGGRPARIVLVTLLALLAAQGFWMWWNARANFTQEASLLTGFIPWGLLPLENVPFPDRPGAVAKNEAWDRLTYIWPALLLIWGVARSASRIPSMHQWVFRAIFITGAALSLAGLIIRNSAALTTFWSDQLGNVYFTYFFATYRSPGIASAYLNVALVMGLSLLLRRLYAIARGGKGMPSAIGLLAGCVLILAGAMAAGSKAGIILTLLTLLMWAGLNLPEIRRVARHSKKFLPDRLQERVLMLTTLVSIILLVGLSAVGTTIQRWQQASESDFRSLEIRANINETQIEMIRDPEWGALGFGPGSFHPLFPYYVDGAQLSGMAVYAHNDHLQTLVEWGWWGSILFAAVFAIPWIFLLPVLRPWGQNQTSGRWRIRQRGVAIAIFVCLIHATIDFPFQIESIAITLAVLVGLAWSGLFKGHPRTS